MTPKITFKEKDGRLIIKIAIHGSGHGIYETGITVTDWNEEKEICGDYQVNEWMRTTRDTLEKSFRPDMNAKRLWGSFINNQSDTSATIKTCFDYYVSSMPLRPNSKSVYISIGRVLDRAGLYDTPLGEVTPALIRGFINGLKTSNASKFNTFVRVKACISRYIKDHNLGIVINLDGMVSKPKYVPKEDGEWLTLPEVQKLLDADLRFVKRDARDLFCLACFSGLSIGDSLKFDPKKNIKKIGGREFFEFSRTKTGVKCTVPVISQAKAIIESRNDWPIRIVQRTMQYQISTTLSGIVGRKIHSHMGRKSAAAIFLQFGFSSETTAKFLGHNILIFNKIYAKISAQKIDNEIERVKASGLAVFSESL